MNEIKFKNLNELYRRVTPALRSKKKELHRSGFNYIHEEDIWNCCRDLYWTKQRDLDLSNLVADILNTDNEVFDNYLKSYIATQKRKIQKDELNEN